MIVAGQESAAVIASMDHQRLASEERARRVRFADRFRIYSDAYQDLIEASVRSVFKDQEKADRISILGDATINPLKQVISEVYAYPGARRIYRDGDTEDATFARLAVDVDLASVMAEAFAVIGGFNDCVIQVLPSRSGPRDEPIGLPRVRVFFPHECSVIEDADDPSQIGQIQYTHRRPDGSEVEVYWTAEEHWVEGKHGREPARGRGDFANPFGRLPFVSVHRGLRPDRFWDDLTGQNLVDFTRQYGRDWAAFNYTQQQQSYKQLVVTGVDEKWPGYSTIGPGTVLTAGPGEAVDVLDLQVDVGGFLEKLKTQLTMFLQSHSVNAERYMQNPGQAPMSGLARMVEREDLLAARRKLYPQILRAEREVAEMLRWAWNWNHVEKISERAVYEVEIFEEKQVESPKERAETRKLQLEVYKVERELGLRTAAEQIAEDLGLSAEEAALRVQTKDAAPTVFAYHIENGVFTLDEIRQMQGIGPHPNPEMGGMTVPELRVKYPAMFGGGSGNAAQENA